MRKIRKFLYAGSLPIQLDWNLLTPEVRKKAVWLDPNLFKVSSKTLLSNDFMFLPNKMAKASLLLNYSVDIDPSFLENTSGYWTLTGSDTYSHVSNPHTGNTTVLDKYNLEVKEALGINKEVRNLTILSGINAATNYLSGIIGDLLFGEDELGRGMGTLFSSGLSATGDTIALNLLKGEVLTKGLGLNVGASLGGAGAGLTAYGIGKGLNALGGDTKLSRGISTGISTGLGTLGGNAISNALKGKNIFTGFRTVRDAKVAMEVAKTAGKSAQEVAAIGKNVKNLAIGNIAGLGMLMVGAGLLAALGPSKEYNGKYGGITKGMDTAYDIALMGASFIPGAGTLISGAMSLNKGLSNLFGSTDGMTRTDAILGSAFMPAPIKWFNMWGAKTTDTFNDLSWLNTQKTNAFMGNAFGNLGEKFDKAREEAGKTYGTFSRGAYNRALNNIDFANTAWDKILAMTDLNELLKIRSLYMTSINNQRYALNILGGWSPLARGKYGMKILNNATNHNIGMRLLSGAALIDNKQMILCNVPD